MGGLRCLIFLMDIIEIIALLFILFFLFKNKKPKVMNRYKFKYVDVDCVPAEVDKYMKTNTIDCKSTRKKIIIQRIMEKYPKILQIFNIVKIK